MTPSEKEQLLREILGDDTLANLRQASLERWISALNQRRRNRTLGAGLLATLAVSASLAILLHSKTRSVARVQITASNDAPPTAASSPEPTPRVKFISDEELLALFPNRSVALIGKPGSQQLVFLDGSSRQASSKF